MIYRYIKKITEGPNGTVYSHYSGEDNALTELATLSDGYTYLALAPQAELPQQPDYVELVEVELTDTQREELSVLSPALTIISSRVVEKIRQRYSVDEEIKCLRLAPSEQTDAWNAYVEQCRQWGRDEKAKLGFA